ncbi:MAG TPA: FHA domain-containing protein [Verrucomicrobiota bacterium]|nr:FHA domain-containing protein [Verrucomicrobiota bacterium]
MASLLIDVADFCDRVIELNLGVNRFGRGPESAFQIEHPTISATHCTLVLADHGLTKPANRWA